MPRSRPISNYTRSADHRSAEGDEDRRAEAQLTSVCERARGYDERCGGQWYPELLRQHRGEKHDVTVPDEVLKGATHASNDTPIQIFPIRYI